MSNVRALPGVTPPPDGPNDVLINCLEATLALARSGQLQSFIGTGFCADGARTAVWCDHHGNVYEMLGSISWLQHEYVHRHTEGLA